MFRTYLGRDSALAGEEVRQLLNKVRRDSWELIPIQAVRNTCNNTIQLSMRGPIFLTFSRPALPVAGRSPSLPLSSLQKHRALRSRDPVRPSFNGLAQIPSSTRGSVGRS